MSPQQDVLNTLKKSLPHLRKTYHVTRLGVFGSFAKNTATENSDVDLVVEFSAPIGLRFVEFSEYLSDRLGRRVDILTPAGIQTIRQSQIADGIMGDAVYV